MISEKILSIILLLISGENICKFKGYWKFIKYLFQDTVIKKSVLYAHTMLCFNIKKIGKPLMHGKKRMKGFRWRHGIQRGILRPISRVETTKGHRKSIPQCMLKTQWWNPMRLPQARNPWSSVYSKKYKSTSM